MAINVAGCVGCCNQKVSDSFVNDCRQIAEVLAEVKTIKAFLIYNDKQLLDIIVDRRLYLTNIKNTVTNIAKKNLVLNRTAQPDEKETTRRIPLKVQLSKSLIAQSDSESVKKFLSYLASSY